jgi:cell wall-associated NlpC family hydrolase
VRPAGTSLFASGLLAVALLLATLATSRAAADNPIAGKHAEAQKVLAEIDRLDERLNRAAEAYDGATYRLAGIRAQIRENRRERRIAVSNLRIAQGRIAALVRELYVAGSPPSGMALILGGQTFGNVLDETEAEQMISSENSIVIGEVTTFRRVVDLQGRALRAAESRQAGVVAERAAAERELRAGLAQRQQLLESIRSEIARLQAEEAARQARLRQEAEERLAAQRAAQQRALSQSVVGITAETPSASGEPLTVVPPSAVGSQVVGIALHYLGVPYVWGGASPAGFDCSGLVAYAFAQLGISLPHYAAAQWNYGDYVAKDQLEPGDLVFFDALGHVGIYIGNDEFVQAPHTGDVVKITSLSDPWAEASYYGARRITG